MILDIRGCMLAAEEGRFEDAKILAEKWHGRYPAQLNLGVFSIRQSLRENGDPASLAARMARSSLRIRLPLCKGYRL